MTRSELHAKHVEREDPGHAVHANKATRSMWQESSKQHAERNQPAQSRRRNQNTPAKRTGRARGKATLQQHFPSIYESLTTSVREEAAP